MKEFNSGNVVTARTTDFADKRLMYKSVKYLRAEQTSSIHIKKNGE